VGAHQSLRPPRQEQGTAQPLRRDAQPAGGHARGRPAHTVPPGPRLGDLVVRAKGLAMGFGDRLLFENASFDLPRGGIVGVIGGNGAGKTTLFKLIAGQLQPLAGTLNRRPDGGRRAQWDQPPRHAAGRAYDLRGDHRRQRVRGTGGPADERAAPTCSRFNFKGADQQKRVATSPAANATACTWPSSCAGGGNLLLLDEPSNDLDVATLRSLEEGLAAFAGWRHGDQP